MPSYRIQIPSWMTTQPTPIAFTVALSGTIYRARISWDPRALPERIMREGEAPTTGAWRLDWRTSTGAPILLGRKIVLTADMWSTFHYKAGIPPGRLQVSRTDGGARDPGLYDLGGPVALDYVID